MSSRYGYSFEVPDDPDFPLEGFVRYWDMVATRARAERTAAEADTRPGPALWAAHQYVEATAANLEACRQGAHDVGHLS